MGDDEQTPKMENPEAGTSGLDEQTDKASASTPIGNVTIAVYADHKSTTPAVQWVSWASLAHSLGTHVRTECSLATCPEDSGKDCPGKYGRAWSPVVIDGTRLDVNVRAVTAIVYDLDDVADLSCVDRLTADGVACAVHSTHSHRDHDQHYRLAIPISRPLTPSEYRRARTAAISQYAIEADPSCPDLSRIYFTPSAPSDAPVVARVIDGAPLDVDRFLAMVPVVVEVANTNATIGSDRIPSGSRNTALASIAGTWRARGLDEDQLRAMLTIENQRRCDPPLDDSEVASIARSIAKKPTQIDPSASSEIAGMMAMLSRQMTPATTGPDVYGTDAADWLAKEFGDDPWIVHGLIPEGVPIILAGHAKAGKSWIELYLALCIATGRPAFGRPTTRTRVLVISREDRDRECQRRIRLLMRWMGIEPEELRGWFRIDCTTPLYFDRPEDVARLTPEITWVERGTRSERTSCDNESA